MIGELPASSNWSFQVQWCPRNPDLLATASFDGIIGVHSLQSTNESEVLAATTSAPQADGADVFESGNFGLTASRASNLSLKQPPKWLRRPVSATFGFGGLLTSVSNLPSAHGGHQSGVVHLRQFATEPIIVDRAKKLEEATDGEKLSEFAQEKSTEAAGEDALAGWKALLSLFRANTRDELVTLLGFSKEEVSASVVEAIKKVKASTATPSAPATNIIPPEPEEADVTETRPYEPVVSFAEPEREPEPLSEPTEGPPTDTDPAASNHVESTPSEVSASATSDVTNRPETESTATEPSLFADDVAIGTPQGDANADFFAAMGNAPTALPGHVLVPHTNYAADSSVAATIGSRPSSVASDTLKTTTFKIYPNEESEIDRLLTKSLVLGDFESAVSLCLSVERYADAILLAVKGGPELLQRTQTAYFTRQTTSLPYLRLYQSIVSNDLDDIVQNAELKEWQEIFVILCTFAREDEFAGLAKHLGQRLEFQGKVIKAADPTGSEAAQKEYRKNATLCYLAAGKLEQIVNIWIDELREEEAILESNVQKGVSRYTAHALALQTFIEKVTVFRSATKYVDADLAAADQSASRSYKLAALYDRYYEYADLLAAQGLLKEAVKYLNMTPAEYKGIQGGMELDFHHARERVLQAAGLGVQKAPAAPTVTVQQQYKAASQKPQVPTTTSYPTSGPYPPTTNVYAPPATTTVKPSPYEAMYAPPNGSTAPATQQPPAPPVNDPYAPPGVTSSQQPQQQQPPYGAGRGSGFVAPNPYGPSYGGGNNQYGTPQTGPYGQPTIPPPGPPPPARAPPKRIGPDQGWNDTPVVDISRRSTPAAKSTAPAAITSPFPNAPGGGSPTSPYMGQQGGSNLPPPPPSRGASQFPPNQLQPPPPQQQQNLPPPPRGGSAMGRPPPPPGPGHGPPPPRGPPGQNPPPFQRPASAGGQAPPGVTYPVRSMSPMNRPAGGSGFERASSPLAHGQVRPPPQPQYGAPPPQQHQQHPRGPPPPGQAGMPPRGPPTPGNPPPHRGPPGPYGPPPGSGGPPAQYAQQRGPPPPGQGSGFAPPPGSRGPPPPGPPQAGIQSPQSPPNGPPAPVKPAAPIKSAPKYRTWFLTVTMAWSEFPLVHSSWRPKSHSR